MLVVVSSLPLTITSPGAARQKLAATPQALAYGASLVGLLLSSAVTASQPFSRSDARTGSAAVSVGSGLPTVSLPEANTTRPPPLMKGA